MTAVAFVLSEFLMIIFTTLGIWRGKWIFSKLTNIPTLLRILLTCIFMVSILFVKNYVTSFYISTIISIMCTIIIFWLIWPMNFRESLYCSLSTMSIIMAIDFFTYSFMLLVDGNNQTPMPYMILAKLMHLLVLLIIFRSNIKGINPLLTIRWHDLDKALRTNLSVVFSIMTISYIINVTLVSLSHKTSFKILSSEFFILNVITFLLFFIAFFVFWVDCDGNSSSSECNIDNEDITDIIGLNRHLLLLSNMNQIKYNVDAELTKLKNLNYESIIKFIEYLSPERTIDVSFLFSYNSLVVVLSITNNCDNLIDDDRYINYKKNLSKEFNVSDNYDADIDAFLIKILQKRREKYEIS